MAIQLHSPAFRDGGLIPERYGYTNANVNPPLEIEGVPDGTASLVLLMDDPDAVEPAGKVWDHWTVWNIDPDRERIPEGWDVSTATEGQNDFGEREYGGPNPPDREHTYRFRLFALDTTLDLEPGASKATVVATMDGQIIEETVLEGTFRP